ncbi:MAG: DNA alkylation repair protein [Prevotella sp.]|nr:DNA alkylation repair protein [Prevotella sp.]
MERSENNDAKSTANEIRQQFRLLMNGVASQSMRDKGTAYHVNWGIQLPQLISLAAEYEKNAELAVMLWKDNVRESKIMATLLMPHEEMKPDMMDLWMQQIPNWEMAEMSVINLFQYAESAPHFAYKWMASQEELQQYVGFLLIGRLFMQQREPDGRGVQEFIDQALVALQGTSLPLRKAALTAVNRFSELGETYRKIAEKAMLSIGLQLF